jgi:hypothetical protein
MRQLIPVAVALLALSGCGATSSVAPDSAPHAVVGVESQHLSPAYWIEHADAPRRVVFDRAAIAAQNARLEQVDTSVRDLDALPDHLAGSQVASWITALSKRPTTPLFDERGAPVEESIFESMARNLNLGAVPAEQKVRFGLVVDRADLRTFPTNLRVFRAQGDADIDRFQESALFPGTPVAIVHASEDGKWFFVVSALYSAWIEQVHVAAGSREEVFGYAGKSPYLVVTGATTRTVFTRERPEVSELQLEMGVRVPLLKDWPPAKPVNGQHPYTSHVIELPWRTAEGALRFTPALLPKTADVASDYLPLTRANLLTQSFKFLGERYGWGHDYNARDCSGFVSEVYRSFGLAMPRNTRDQGVSPAARRVTFSPDDPKERRLAALRNVEVGDLVYIPGHVMMVIGLEGGMPYIIHDTTGISYRDSDGEVRRVPLNGVAVTPLMPLLLSDDEPMIDRIYSIVQMRASNAH